MRVQQQQDAQQPVGLDKDRGLLPRLQVARIPYRAELTHRGLRVGRRDPHAGQQPHRVVARADLHRLGRRRLNRIGWREHDDRFRFGRLGSKRGGQHCRGWQRGDRVEPRQLLTGFRCRRQG